MTDQGHSCAVCDALGTHWLRCTRCEHDVPYGLTPVPATVDEGWTLLPVDVPLPTGWEADSPSWPAWVQADPVVCSSCSPVGWVVVAYPE